MLVSKTKQGEWFCLANNENLKKLKELRKKESFYCPECEEQVIMKVGTKKIPHFAHQKGSACSESYERESEYHLKGKLALYNWLKSEGLSPQLEPYLKEIAQRPDVSFTYKGIPYAIEYQCSVIPEELFIRRTENYFKANITPIWIMGGKNVKRKGFNFISLSRFDYLFLSKSANSTWHFPAYCPLMNSLITIHHIIPVTIKNSLVKFSITNLKSAHITDLLTPKLVGLQMPHEWRKEIHKLKTIKIPLYNNVQSKFLQELYHHGLSPSLLPHEIGLPVPNIHYIETSAIEWQSYLYIDVLKNRKSISMGQIIHAFKRRVRNQDIKLRNFPLEPNGHAVIAVTEYIDLLVKLNILQTSNKINFNVINSIIEFNNLVDFLEGEKSFYHKYEKLISESLK